MSPEAITPTAVAGASTGTPDTEVVSATRAAADKGDVSSFLDADRSARRGQRVEKVERPKAAAPAPGPVAGKGGEPAKGPSAADRDSDARLTARIREAVDLSTAELRRQNQELQDRLERAAGGTRRDTAAPVTEKPPAPGPTKLEIKKYREMPDSPKLDDKDPTTGEFLYDTAQDHAVALSLFIQEKQSGERASAAAKGDRLIARTRSEAARVTNFSGKIEEFKKTDPEFGKKLTPEVAGIHGFAMLEHVNAQRQANGQPPIPATVDHAIGELIYDSDYPAHVAVHLSAHPEDLAALRKAPNPAALAKAFARVEDKAAGVTAAAVVPAHGNGAGADRPNKQPAADARARADQAVDRSLSSAHVPQTNLGKPGSTVDPYDHAIKSGDVGMFLELDRQRMAERRGLR